MRRGPCKAAVMIISASRSTKTCCSPSSPSFWSRSRVGVGCHMGGQVMIRPSKILIVDDDPFHVDYLEQELEDLGYTTVSARNGCEALEKVALEAPDLILLDLMMPIMDGLAVCRILKGDDETRLIPIVIMTALDGFDDRIKGIEAGADDFLIKPVNQRELLARMQTALRLKHTVDEKLSELRRTKDHFAKFVPEAVDRKSVV